MKLCPKIILEGTRLTHKTDTDFALNEHPRIVGPRMYRYHSPLISAEWCGFTNFPWGRGLINFEPQEESLAKVACRTWARLFQLLRYYSWIVDRFHISALAYQQLYRGRISDFGWLEAILVELGFRIVFCVRRPVTFADARAERIQVSGDRAQYDDLQIFLREQDLLGQFIAASALPSLRLDVSGGDIAHAADSVADWLDSTGGLYAT
jgi:hypothetical protein